MKSLLDLEDQFAEVNSVHTRYRHAGDSGPGVVLVHGLGGYVECWTPLFDALSVNHRVFAMDLVGFGKTAKPDGTYTYPFFADFVYDFFRALDIPQAHLIGWSLGGGTALQFTIKHPEMVEKLVLIGSGGLSKKFGLGLRILTVPLLGKWLSKPSLEGSRKSFEYMIFDPEKIQPQWISHDHTINMIPGVQSSILRTLKAGATIFGGRRKVLDPIVDNLRSITAPTYVIWGGQDRVIPVDSASVAKQLIPDCRQLILDDCGHCPHVEYPNQVAEAILRFF